jgi:hypothetical protein
MSYLVYSFLQSIVIIVPTDKLRLTNYKNQVLETHAGQNSRAV